MALRKILTLDNLRNMIVVYWCYMCKMSVESIDCLLLHCEVAIELWILIFHFFKVEWVMPRIVIELLAYWRS
jgi:hypothetical protein